MVLGVSFFANPFTFSGLEIVLHIGEVLFFNYVPLFFFRPIKKYEKNAPRVATMVQRIKAEVNVPVVSLIQPPMKGAKTWPIPKNRVTTPNPAEASCPPTASPTAAAIMTGIAKAVRPNIMADR